MKTINELNSKWWYRLVKVVFIGFALLCMVVSVFIIQDDNRPRQVQDYKVDCIADYTNHKTFIAEKDAGIYIFRYGTDTVYQSLSDDAKQKIRSNCDISEAEAQNATDKAVAYINEQTKLGTDKETIQNYLNDNLRAYLISETQVTKGSYLSIVAYSILSIILILVVAEIIRRIFYYIVLGSIKPKKMQ